ncbi:hypothetical protein GCM10007207_26660 [Asaia siamensis]|uniref:Uncharacterized protein n=1 Tax=Asaia siamensis TaxID=110479 RepID=A0ABQ1MFI9_9PROT|nr:hypothetical protein GCM10007207_26660 [Asaia siamensis]
MGEQETKADIAFAVRGEIGKERADLRVEGKPARFYQLHEAERRDERLRQRCHVEDCVERELFPLWYEGAVTDDRTVHHRIVVPDDENGTRHFSVMDRLRHESVDGGKGGCRAPAQSQEICTKAQRKLPSPHGWISS